MKVGESIKVPGVVCPFCANLIDGAASVENDSQPHSGAIALCIYCAQISVYTESEAGLQLRRPNAGEMEAAFAEDPAGAEIIRGVQRSIRQLPNRVPK
jgi:hypothetical protein